MQYDKRNLKRYDVFLIVEFKPLKNMSDSAIGITRDLSTEGFSMEAQSFDSKCGEMLEFRLKHPDTNLTVVVSGKVVWKTHSWYKYMIGVKFPEISEEQNAKLSELISVVTKVMHEPGLSTEDSETILVKEKEEVMAGKAAPVKIERSIPDAAMTDSDGRHLKVTEYSGLTDLERNFIAGDKVAEETGHADHIEKTESAPEGVSSSQVSRITVEGAEEIAAQKICEDKVDAAEKNRKTKTWIYVPAVTVGIIILLIALPVMIKTFNAPTESLNPALTQSILNEDINIEQSLFAADDMQVPEEVTYDMPEPAKIKETPVRDSAEDKKKVQDIITPPKEKKSPGTDLIARIKAPVKSAQVVENKKPQEVKPLALPSIAAKKDKTVQPEPLLLNKKISVTEISNEPEKIIEPAQAPFTESVKNEKMLEPGSIVTAEEQNETAPVVRTEEPLLITSLTVKSPPTSEQTLKGDQKPDLTLPDEKNEKGPKARLVVKAQEVPKVALFVKRDKLRADQNISKKNGEVNNTGSSKKWKLAGSNKNGIPVFIDTESISYPAEHIVNVLIKVTYNNKDFIDLVAINCSQVRLRIIEASSGKHPVLSDYSSKWRNIIPDIMVLYNSVCSAKS